MGSSHGQMRKVVFKIIYFKKNLKSLYFPCGFNLKTCTVNSWWQKSSPASVYLCDWDKSLATSGHPFPHLADTNNDIFTLADSEIFLNVD